MKHFFSLLLVVFFLFGCVTSPIQKSTKVPQNWPLKAKQLTKIQSWRLAATLGIKTKHKVGSFRVDWLQDKQNYEILCLGAFGQSIGKLTGTLKFASLTLNTGEQKIGDPSVLSEKMLGVSVPFQQLFFWVRGMPDPKLPSQLFFNDKGEAAEINQLGWKISYSVGTSPPFSLPQKITLEKSPIQVKMVISNWDVTNGP